MALTVYVTCFLVLFASAGVAGWKFSERRFTQPVDVPLNCGNGGTPPAPAQPQ